jgi:WD40 repeat protein
LALAPPGQLRLLRGWRTAGPSNSAHKETRSSALPQSRSDSRYGTLICYRFGQSQNRPGIARSALAAAVLETWILMLSGHQERGNSAASSPDGRRIVTASEDGTARIWNAATGKEIVALRGHRVIVPL